MFHRRYLTKHRANTEPDYLNVEKASSLAAESAKTNQLLSCGK